MDIEKTYRKWCITKKLITYFKTHKHSIIILEKWLLLHSIFQFSNSMEKYIVDDFKSKNNINTWFINQFKENGKKIFDDVCELIKSYKSINSFRRATIYNFRYKNFESKLPQKIISTLEKYVYDPNILLVCMQHYTIHITQTYYLPANFIHYLVNVYMVINEAFVSPISSRIIHLNKEDKKYKFCSTLKCDKKFEFLGNFVDTNIMENSSWVMLIPNIDFLFDICIHKIIDEVHKKKVTFHVFTYFKSENLEKCAYLVYDKILHPETYYLEKCDFSEKIISQHTLYYYIIDSINIFKFNDITKLLKCPAQ